MRLQAYGWTDLLLGSVADYCVRNSRYPVVVSCQACAALQLQLGASVAEPRAATAGCRARVRRLCGTGGS